MFWFCLKKPFVLASGFGCFKTRSLFKLMPVEAARHQKVPLHRKETFFAQWQKGPIDIDIAPKMLRTVYHVLQRHFNHTLSHSSLSCTLVTVSLISILSMINRMHNTPTRISSLKCFFHQISTCANGMGQSLLETLRAVKTMLVNKNRLLVPVLALWSVWRQGFISSLCGRS